LAKFKLRHQDPVPVTSLLEMDYFSDQWSQTPSNLLRAAAAVVATKDAIHYLINSGWLPGADRDVAFSVARSNSRVCFGWIWFNSTQVTAVSDTKLSLRLPVRGRLWGQGAGVVTCISVAWCL
jgi:hypothetical protein